MPRPDPRTIATAESRAAGGRARAAKLREQRAHAQAVAEERLLDLVEEAIEALRVALSSDNEQVAVRAAAQLLDRALGRPTQAAPGAGGSTWSGLHNPNDLQATVDNARRKLEELINRRSSGAPRRSLRPATGAKNRRHATCSRGWRRSSRGAPRRTHQADLRTLTRP